MVGAEGHLLEKRTVSDVVGANSAVGAADNDNISGLEADADHLDLLGRGPDQALLELEIAIFDRVHDKVAVDGTGNELSRGVEIGGRRLDTEAPDLAVLAARVLLCARLFEVPFGDGVGVADTEQTRLAVDDLAVAHFFIGVGYPDQAVDAPVIAAGNQELLVPGTIERVPDLDVAIGATNSEAHLNVLLEVLLAGWDWREGGVGECDSVDGGSGIGNEATPVNIHDGGFLSSIIWMKEGGARGAGAEVGGRRASERPVEVSSRGSRSLLDVWALLSSRYVVGGVLHALRFGFFVI